MEVEKGEHLLKYQTTENVQSIPIKEIQPFRNHPFTVADNEDMAKIVESIGKVGTITPLLARPLPDGGYELISGHRRLEACRKLRLDTIPVIVREMTDDEAVIAMVDANLQREHILPSEKSVRLQDEAGSDKSSRKSLWTSCPQVKRYCFQHRQRKAGAAIYQTDEVDSAAFENG